MASLIDPSGRPLKARDKDPAKTAAPSPGAASGAIIKDSSLPTFAADVLDASMTVPVIVDFWAPWCGPCKQLTPLLERAVTEAKGKVRLVKVNIDENPEIAQQLRIQSIPTVYAFKNGQPVDGFSGSDPESQMKTFIQG
jgi:putative thioredoxin